MATMGTADFLLRTVGLTPALKGINDFERRTVTAVRNVEKTARLSGASWKLLERALESATAKHLEQAMATGDLEEALKDLEPQMEAFDRGQKKSGRRQEEGTKTTRKSIVAYAALGAAIGVVFTSLLRSSAVITTLSSAFLAVFGALVDTILVRFVPAIVGAIPVIQDLGDAFGGLDPLIQDLILGIGGLVGGILLIPAHPILGLIAAIAGLFTLARPFEAFWKGVHDALLPVYDAIVNVDVAIEQFLSDTIGAPAEQALRDFAHTFQVWAADLAFGAALFVIDVQNAWGGLVDWFGDLWDDIGLAASVTWAAITNTFTRAWDDIVGFFQGFIDALTGPLETFLNAFIDGINLLIAGLNAISLGVAAIPAIPHVDLGADGGGAEEMPRAGETWAEFFNRHARHGHPRGSPGHMGAAGGIFTHPTNVLLGEAGPEALIPLTGPIAPALLAPIFQAAMPRGGSRPITIQVTNHFVIEYGGGVFGVDESFREQFKRAGEEVGQGILTTLHRRRE